MAGQAAATASVGDCDSPTALARDLLVACKRGDSTDGLRAALAALDDGDLQPLREDRRTALTTPGPNSFSESARNYTRARCGSFASSGHPQLQSQRHS
jgi:hypothetical protein